MGKLISKEDLNKSVAKVINQELIALNFYGKITFHFESGKIVLIKKEESIKP